MEAPPRLCHDSGVNSEEEGRRHMPFVTIRILAGHPQQRKDAIARRVVDAISEETGLPRDAVWVTFDDIAATDWYIADETVASLKKARGEALPGG
jgi:4-oxalocrotonate tautomerase